MGARKRPSRVSRTSFPRGAACGLQPAAALSNSPHRQRAALTGTPVARNQQWPSADVGQTQGNLSEDCNMTAKKKESMVTGVFRDKADADRAYDALIRRGYTDSQINVLMSDRTRTSYYPTKTTGAGRKDDKHEAGSLAVEGMGVGGAIGTAVGPRWRLLQPSAPAWSSPANLIIAGPIVAAPWPAAARRGHRRPGAHSRPGFTEENAEAYHAALRGRRCPGRHPTQQHGRPPRSRRSSRVQRRERLPLLTDCRLRLSASAPGASGKPFRHSTSSSRWPILSRLVCK
jgi:hypothetical protein